MIKSKPIILALLSIFIAKASAQEQYNGAWFDISTDGNLIKKYRIDYIAQAQLRTLDKNNSYEMSYLQGGLGYRPHPGLSSWIGYQWNSFNPIFNLGRENRIFEQVLWEIWNDSFFALRTRTRLEQRNRMHNPEWSNRLREKISFYFPQIKNRYTPLIYDELFFNLTKPDWVSSSTLEQNRAFIGMDISLSKKVFLELGYLQQSFYGLQQRTNHILYISININSSQVALPDYTP